MYLLLRSATRFVWACRLWKAAHITALDKLSAKSTYDADAWAVSGRLCGRTRFREPMSSFGKHEDCPASDELLAYQAGDGSQRLREMINSHLTQCEFCVAELAFYSHYPQSEDRVTPAEMPRPLFELAEALLGRKRDKDRILKRLFRGD